MNSHIPVANQTPAAMLELLSAVTVGDRHGYICARSYPSTAKPPLYDVRYDDGQIEIGVSADRITGIMPPTLEQQNAVRR